MPSAFSGLSAPARSTIEKVVSRKLFECVSSVSNVRVMAQCERDEPSFMRVATTLRLPYTRARNSLRIDGESHGVYVLPSTCERARPSLQPIAVASASLRIMLGVTASADLRAAHGDHLLARLAREVVRQEAVELDRREQQQAAHSLLLALGHLTECRVHRARQQPPPGMLGLGGERLGEAKHRRCLAGACLTVCHGTRSKRSSRQPTRNRWSRNRLEGGSTVGEVQAKIMQLRSPQKSASSPGSTSFPTSSCVHVTGKTVDG